MGGPSAPSRVTCGRAIWITTFVGEIAPKVCGVLIHPAFKCGVRLSTPGCSRILVIDPPDRGDFRCTKIYGAQCWIAFITPNNEEVLWPTAGVLAQLPIVTDQSLGIIPELCVSVAAERRDWKWVKLPAVGIRQPNPETTLNHLKIPSRHVRDSCASASFHSVGPSFIRYQGSLKIVLPVPPTPSRSDDDTRTPPIRTIIIRIWAVIIGIWIRVITRPACYCGRLRRRFLIHVKINALRDCVGVGPAPARAIAPNLRVLVRGKGRSLNDIIIVAEIVEGSVAVAKNFEMDGCVANVFSIGFNSCPGFGGFDQDVISDGPVRAPFNAWRNGLAASEEAGQRCSAGKNEVLRFHWIIGVLQGPEFAQRRAFQLIRRI
jgi:hypothetical protein